MLDKLKIIDLVNAVDENPGITKVIRIHFPGSTNSRAKFHGSILVKYSKTQSAQNTKQGSNHAVIYRAHQYILSIAES